MQKDPGIPSYTELNPLKAMRPELVRKGHIIPAAVACVGIIGLFTASTNFEFWFLTACFLSAAVLGLIYALCGMRKSWWVLAATVVATALLLRYVLGDTVAELDKRLGVLGPGLAEELFKSIPIFALYWYAKNSQAANRREIGVTEPLDGILIGAAAGIGFTFIETLYLYAPRYGWQLVLPRFLGNLFGHAAWSAYLGYFIGLAALRPHRQLRTILTGLAFSFAAHTAWDFLPDLAQSAASKEVILIGVGILTYAGLAAAILKGREISPSRQDNFATRLVRPSKPAEPSRPVREQPRSACLSLMGLAGPIAGERFQMTVQRVKLGRDPAECQIVLHDGSGKISRVHCSVTLDATGSRLSLEDHHSTNGTFLGNGERLVPGQPAVLFPNTTFYLGTPAIMFQVVSE